MTRVTVLPHSRVWFVTPENDDDTLTPTGYPPLNTAVDMAYSAHSTQPALRPHRATSRVEDKETGFQLGFYTILSWPILYGVWNTQGG